MPERKLSSWIEGFLDYTDNIGSPYPFRLWAAIATIAGALERKVWVVNNKGPLYPNIYTFLVGPPGAGKTIVTSLAYEFLSELETHHLASSNVSRASLIDDLRDAERRLIKPEQVPSIVSFNSLTAVSGELGSFLPSYDNDFMSALTDLYDCKTYSERKRTRELHFKIESPQLNFLAATTPSYLNALLPEGAWEQGFLSRVILVYSGESTPQPLWDRIEQNAKLYQHLLTDLKRIGDIYGKMTFSPEAAAAISEWHVRRGPPQPEHPKLHHYTTRRTAHLLKLCLIASAECSDTMFVEIEDYQRALGWLLAAEAAMPEIFKSMTTGGDGKVMDETWYFTYQIYLKEKKPIAEYRVINFLSERTPAHNISRILEHMVKGKIFTETVEPVIGRAYTPRPRKA